MSCTGCTFTATDICATAVCPGLILAGRLWTVLWHMRATRNSGTVHYEQQRDREETHMKFCTTGRTCNGF